MNDSWTLNIQLENDCHRLGCINKIELLLHKNAALPWFILVPHCHEEDLLALEPAYRNQIMDMASRVADYIRTHTAFKKINVASIGNVVSQLHLHVIGRKTDDACWPKPAWGNLKQSQPYDNETIQSITQTLLS